MDTSNSLFSLCSELPQPFFSSCRLALLPPLPCSAPCSPGTLCAVPAAGDITLFHSPAAASPQVLLPSFCLPCPAHGLLSPLFPDTPGPATMPWHELSSLLCALPALTLFLPPEQPGNFYCCFFFNHSLGASSFPFPPRPPPLPPPPSSLHWFWSHINLSIPWLSVYNVSLLLLKLF